ncbi:MAG: SCO family protein [Candidatus Porifericomitaceae bacterium WSBS_2022_MAG_OTU9]
MQNEPHKNEGGNKNVWVVVLLLVVCAGPVVLSWVLVGYADNISFADASHGELIDPAIKLSDKALGAYIETQPESGLRGRWSLLYWAEGYCNLPCQQKLEHIQRIRQALSREAHRLQPILFSSYDPPQGLSYGGEHKLLLWQPTSQADELLSLAIKDPRIGGAGDYYLIDPLGNLLIRYKAGTDPVGIIKDIKRLMRASRIG